MEKEYPHWKPKYIPKVQNLEAEDIIFSGPIPRQKANCLNIIMDQNVPELANKVAQMNADAAVNALRLRIV